jgi:hypothetical protein
VALPLGRVQIASRPMGPNRRAQERDRAAARAAEEAKPAEAECKASSNMNWDRP